MSAISLKYDFLNERFEVSPDSRSGLKWRPRVENSKRDVSWNKLYAGKDCGNITIDQDGRRYYVSSISRNNDKRKVFNHKVVYAIHHKKDLDGGITIGHMDGDTTNNKPENLMECHKSEQYHMKSRVHSRNKSGHPGVHFCVRKQRYIAQITFKCRKIKIGQYLSKEDAIKARQDYQAKLFETA